jgi:hypothetical protein
MKLEVAKDGKHKYVAVFDDGKRVPFGARGYDDFTKTADQDQRARYLARHRASEDWNDPHTPASLSRWILWGQSRSIQDNLRAFKRRFNMD